MKIGHGIQPLSSVFVAGVRLPTADGRGLGRHAGEPVADKAVGYFKNNRSRLRYPRYRDMGLLIGSGVVESSCGTLVAARFKHGGMHWNRRWEKVWR